MEVPWQMSTITMHDVNGCDYYELHPAKEHEPEHVLFVSVTVDVDVETLVVGYGAHIDDQGKRNRLPFKGHGTTFVRHSSVATEFPYIDGAPRKRELWVGTVGKRAHGIFAVKLSRPARVDVQLCEADAGTTVEAYVRFCEVDPVDPRTLVGLAELKRRARARLEAREKAGLQ